MSSLSPQLRLLTLPRLLLVLPLTLLLVFSTFIMRHPFMLSITPVPNTLVPLTRAPNFGKLPLSFILNTGQMDSAVRFQARSMGGSLFFTPNEVVLSLSTPTATIRQGISSDPLTHGLVTPHRGRELALTVLPTAVRLRFAGANPSPQVVGAERLPGTVNYFIGNDPAKWRTNVPTYAGIVYRQLYPGIDLRYDGRGDQLKGTYTLAPGADPTRIHWYYDGARSMQVDATTGDLMIGLPPTVGAGAEMWQRTLIERAPIAWQEINGQHIPVTIRYVVSDDASIGFALSNYDSTQPLTIDPTLEYSTYLGGSSGDVGVGIAVDSAGNTYVTGLTDSSNFPTLTPFQGTYAGGGADVFVTKLNAAGNALVYSTYLGGQSGDDQGIDIVVDDGGNVYLTGLTRSNDFPTVNPLYSGAGGVNAFVTKLDTTGSALIYSTYLGGSGDDDAEAIAVDGGGNTYITGRTRSGDFPTANPFQATIGGSGEYDAFITKLNANGSALVYSTYLGEASRDEGFGITVDSASNAYITGFTFSSNFPTVNSVQQFGGFADAFVAKFNPTGNTLAYSTFLGGSEREFGNDIIVDNVGNVYIAGQTLSNNFPTVNPLQGTFGGGSPNSGFSDGFVAKLDATGSTVIYSTYLGGNGADEGSRIAADSGGSAYIIGRTASSNFPLVNPIQGIFGGGIYDAFVVKLNSSGNTLLYSTYLGGNSGEEGRGIAVDSIGNAYVTGSTGSTNFPTANPLQAAIRGGGDAFVAKISPRTDTTVPLITSSVDCNNPGNTPWCKGTITVSWTVDDQESPITSTSGCGTAIISTDTPPIGTTLTCTATSAGGTSSQSVTVFRDGTAPTTSCSVSPNQLSPSNHKLVTVQISVMVNDPLSGAAGFTLISVTSNEPDAGLGGGDKPNDIQGFSINSPDTSGQLRAERSNGGNGRIYTLTYQGLDAAGNTSTCAATVTVPR